MFHLIISCDRANLIVIAGTILKLKSLLYIQYNYSTFVKDLLEYIKITYLKMD